ncbi:hypothetical protein [Actinoplanes sp. N902-109]|uniref:hypothetical protein n=1 Tax=Actinoplanes sp. (strain N902-109) TaxID=649831 RepID=UPI0003296339|nr:hypothetical protein [Actinoplanes sp. N902-109]AGL17974.1 hypothetical protein L083_4464 [Actinoplanes sp. N902-109]
MVLDTLPVPQFRADNTAEDAPPVAPAADHSDEAMARLRHPFDPQPAGAVTRENA